MPAAQCERGGSHDLLLTARKYFAHSLELKREHNLRALYGLLSTPFLIFYAPIISKPFSPTSVTMPPFWGYSFWPFCRAHTVLVLTPTKYFGWLIIRNTSNTLYGFWLI